MIWLARSTRYGYPSISEELMLCGLDEYQKHVKELVREDAMNLHGQLIVVKALLGDATDDGDGEAEGDKRPEEGEKAEVFEEVKVLGKKEALDRAEDFERAEAPKN